jgi:hypothetical protein
MTPAGFRCLALSLPEAEESAHMGHPDFRIRRKIFASIGWPDKTRGMVKLAPEEQAMFVDAEPAIFKPVPGGWGRRGYTLVRLTVVDATTLQQF